MDSGGKQILEAMTVLQTHMMVKNEAKTLRESSSDITKSMNMVADFSVEVNTTSKEINTGIKSIENRIKEMGVLADDLNGSMNRQKTI